MHTAKIGERVQVWSFGRWYWGYLSKVGRTRLRVVYVTGTGTRRDRWFTGDRVRSEREALAVAAEEPWTPPVAQYPSYRRHR